MELPGGAFRDPDEQALSPVMPEPMRRDPGIADLQTSPGWGALCAQGLTALVSGLDQQGRSGGRAGDGGVQRRMAPAQVPSPDISAEWEARLQWIDMNA